ncbi:uncharacterized protein N7459_008613 [Penicillium hispanicum]|uniref:uncharacterized protein n=1 Tax=Penicillium hispanicum TaxID=1080232 RepID=UPI002541FEC5|nr:uncharacterized protein N7459_008613 [Penicillium hispanicum]KAJ5574186.1 hypothetical protein N7459_008613 [Penicillium hispanicum]
MVDPAARSGHSKTKTAVSSAGVRKLTLSCSRCRASKLKCDRKEPCIECIKRSIGHLCTKDERQPRVKRAKPDHSNDAKINETEAESTADLLEQFFEGRSTTNVVSTVGPNLSCVAPDFPNLYWDSDDPQKQSEKWKLMKETIDVLPDEDMIAHIYEVFITRCQGPLGNIVHTPTFLAQAKTLYECLSLPSTEEKATALLVSITMDMLACHLLALVLGIAFHPTPNLLGWSPTALNLRIEEFRSSHLHVATWRSLALRCLQGPISIFCGSIASLQAAIMLLLDGQEGHLELDSLLVTAISGARKLGLHRLGGAQLDPSASLSSMASNSPVTIPSPHIRIEVGIRIWWALVIRDWSRGQALGYYSIQPSHFNTRMPLHINDEDLLPVNAVSSENITERPRSEFTMLSYTIHVLEIMVLVRESTDLRNSLREEPRKAIIDGNKMQSYLIKKYESFVASLPPHFRLGSTIGLTSAGPLAAVPVQQWMLHQQLWSLFLRLHRPGLSSNDGRASCHLLAQNIISSHAQIQARCAVCGSLSIGDVQLSNAAVVLLIDLLFSSKSNGVDSSATRLSRLMTRDKIREAIELLRARGDVGNSRSQANSQHRRSTFSTRQSITALEALMELEEELSEVPEGWDKRNEAGATSDAQSRKSLRSQVIETLKNLPKNINNALASEEPTWASPSAPGMTVSSAPNGFPEELDILPVVSNDPECDLWQFLEFPSVQSPSQDSFPVVTDWQTFVDSIPFAPLSDATL